MSSSASVDAWQRTLAAEHAAIFVLGTLGGRASALTAPDLPAALDRAYDVHLDRRDHLRTVISAAGADPVAAEAAYRLRGPLTTAAQIAAQALRTERACATTYAALVAATSGAHRAWAVDALVATAVGEAAFGGDPQPLPGLD